MTKNFFSAEQQRQQSLPAPRSMRWVILLVASLLLHVVVFNWANGRIGIPSWRSPAPPVIMTELQTAPAPKPAPQLPPVAATPKPKPKPKPRRRPAPPPPAVPPVADAASLPPPASATSEVPDASAEATADVGSEAAGAPANPVPPNSETPAEQSKPQQAAAPHYKVSPPPSAELKYDVQALREGQTWHGAGMFRWESAGSNYTVSGEASITIIFKITVLNFHSEGEINDSGIAPVLYSEKPFRKSLTNTHFQHDKHKISFSASQAVYPYNGGEQDRASIIWQLASIGRGDPAQFTPGAVIDVVVAGARDADNWQIRVIGQEQVETASGRLSAWHVMRVPRPGSYDQTIDIWLAPQQEWYPVKVRYTYVNGDYLELSLANLTPAAR